MPSSFVHLADEGLQDGDTIDGFLSSHFNSGTMCIIPQGDYNWNGGGLGSHADAYVIGEGPNVFFHTGGDRVNFSMRCTNGTYFLKNITTTGRHESNGRIASFADSSGDTLFLENFNRPDGCVDGDSIGFYSGGSDHQGQMTFKDCHVSQFSNNGLYMSSASGPVHVEGGLYENNNIANVRLGSDNSYVKHAAIRIDDRIPRINGGTNGRGIWIREAGDNIGIEDNHITALPSRDGSSGMLIGLQSRDSGGGGTCKRNIIRNDTSINPLHHSAGSWDASGNQVSGTGDVTGDLSGSFSCVDGSSPFSCDQPVPGAGKLPGRRLEVIPIPGIDIASYSFTVDGRIEHVDNVGRLSSDSASDIITNNGDGTYSMSGFVAGGAGDSFQIHGDLISWTDDLGAADDEIYMFLDSTRISRTDIAPGDGTLEGGTRVAVVATPRTGSAVDTGGTNRDGGSLTDVRAGPVQVIEDTGNLTAVSGDPVTKTQIGEIGTSQLGGSMLGGPISHAVQPFTRKVRAIARSITSTERTRGALEVESGDLPAGGSFAPRGSGPIKEDTDVVEPAPAEAEAVAADTRGIVVEDGNLLQNAVRPRIGHTEELWWDDFEHFDTAESESIDFVTEPGIPQLADGETSGVIHLGELSHPRVKPDTAESSEPKGASAALAADQTGITTEDSVQAEADANIPVTADVIGNKTSDTDEAASASVPRTAGLGAGATRVEIDPTEAAATTETGRVRASGLTVEATLPDSGAVSLEAGQTGTHTQAVGEATGAGAGVEANVASLSVTAGEAVSSSTARPNPIVEYASTEGDTDEIGVTVEASLPEGARVWVSVVEDRGADGTGDNAQTVEVVDGLNHYSLTGFEASGLNAYWPVVFMERGDGSTSPSVELVVITYMVGS